LKLTRSAGGIKKCSAAGVEKIHHIMQEKKLAGDERRD
jgi:hypothetical protein